MPPTLLISTPRLAVSATFQELAPVAGSAEASMFSPSIPSKPLATQRLTVGHAIVVGDSVSVL